ncbi:MAG TPA: hypothetical protein VI037_01640 [Nitrososphaera sp.]
MHLAQMKMMTHSQEKRQQDDQGIPLEIDTHYKLYGKHAWEVQYGERCPSCSKRIDEFGFCACGGVQ